MKLTALALSNANTRFVRHELAGLLRCTEQTIIRHIRKNEDNGPLTKLAVITMLEELTGLTSDQLIIRNIEPVNTKKAG